MKKNSIKWTFCGLISMLFLSACGRLNTIPYNPLQTPTTWLQIQPFLNIKLGANEIVLVQPSTTTIVYLLGILTIVSGLYFLKIRAHQQSRLWWGIALLLWGVGALLAGTSYEAFSYAIKCAGREACLWTSWWEIGYLLFTVWSVDAMTMAMAQSSTFGRLRKVLSAYALGNAVIYLILILTGVFVPVKFLISFEFLLIVSTPSFLAFFTINLLRYRKYKLSPDLAFLGAWLWLAVTVAAYFLYYVSGLTDSLWSRGVWFSENDVLHICLILWMLYLAFIAFPGMADASQKK